MEMVADVLITPMFSEVVDSSALKSSFPSSS